jgi:hypothetical protein
MMPSIVSHARADHAEIRWRWWEGASIDGTGLDTIGMFFGYFAR